MKVRNHSRQPMKRLSRADEKKALQDRVVMEERWGGGGGGGGG